MSRLLINENPLIVLPELATKIGLNAAIALQQLHYWIDNNKKRKKKNHYHDGRWWAYNTVEEWQEDFPFWSTRTIQRVFKALREAKPHPLVLTGNFNRTAYDKTLWYTIDYEAVDQLSETECPDLSEQGTDIDMDNLSTPIPETIHRLTKDPPSAELVKPSQKPQESTPLKTTEKLCNPELNLEEKSLEGVTIEEPDETIPTEYAVIDDLNPYANTLFCPVCNHTQPWPRTRTARRKRKYLICEECGVYFHVFVEGENRAYSLKLPERVWKVQIGKHGPFPCTLGEYREFLECWFADRRTFESVVEWWMRDVFPRQPLKNTVIARCIAGWHSRKKKEPVVPEPEVIDLGDIPGWDD